MLFPHEVWREIKTYFFQRHLWDFNINNLYRNVIHEYKYAIYNKKFKPLAKISPFFFNLKPNFIYKIIKITDIFLFKKSMIVYDNFVMVCIQTVDLENDFFYKTLDCITHYTDAR
jgi:hypothetical protein